MPKIFVLLIFCFQNIDAWKSTVVILFLRIYPLMLSHSTCLNTLIQFNDSWINCAMCKVHGRMYVIVLSNTVHAESLNIKTYSSRTVMVSSIFRCLKKEDSWSINGSVFFNLFEGSAYCMHYLAGMYLLQCHGEWFQSIFCILHLLLIHRVASSKPQKIITVHTDVWPLETLLRPDFCISWQGKDRNNKRTIFND